RARIHRADRSYHVVPISVNSTVAELRPSFNQKLLPHQERETHRPSLKERGRERVLAPTEMSAAIVIRRLQQAGYDQADSLAFLGAEDMTFLMKFVYKSQLLGPAAEELTFDEFEIIGLTGCSLPTIPIVLHQNASSIVYLNLSCNPMVEIPVDFIQSCVTLLDLSLSSMAMKKVPQSVCRIVDLDDAMPCIVELDMSFNTITELPKEIGRLTALEHHIFVGNQVTKLPEECRNLANLQLYDCRRNNISDISVAYTLPKLEKLYADHNFLMSGLDISHNDITFLEFAPTASPRVSHSLTVLDVSYAKLSSLDTLDFSQLPSLRTLVLDHNELRTLPDSLGELSHLRYLSCYDNKLVSLPATIGLLQRLETLDAHNNSLTELPVSLWNCASLMYINVTSNLLATWHDPPGDNLIAPAPSGIILEISAISSSPSRPSHMTRKPSSATLVQNAPGRPLPPLACSLERLSIGENRLTNESIPPFTILKELRVLNLSFNEIQALPPSFLRNLQKLEEFVIIGNHGLWKYVSYQTAVDIARSEASDPMIADKSSPVSDSLMDPEIYSSIKKKEDIADRTIARLEGEVPPPIGHLCLVFTDIRNSTQLWEANAGMPTAMRLHNNLLRRHLRYCGGYVVKTEGDAFMCSFPTTLAAMWWCLTVQMQLLREFWPLEILECDEGKEVHDEHGKPLARGLAFRMGVHCGTPVCESDLIIGRMDYFGPIVIRAARISGNAACVQIMCSAGVVREINAKIFETGPDTEYSEFQPAQAIEVIRQMQIAVIPAGEIKLKGLEIPEVVSLVYPAALLGRQDLDASGSSLARVQLSIGQVRELAVLCLRFEALASSHVFCPHSKGRTVADLSLETLSDEDVVESSIMYGDPSVPLPPMNDKTPDLEIMLQLDSLSLRLENAANSLALRSLADQSSAIMTALEGQEGIDERML
ncbi:L domain-like protein, partial [Rhizopogon salebrosus TDB-379]